MLSYFSHCNMDIKKDIVTRSGLTEMNSQFGQRKFFVRHLTMQFTEPVPCCQTWQFQMSEMKYYNLLFVSPV